MKNINVNVLKHIPAIGFFFFHLNMENVLGFVLLSSFCMADILGYFCTSSEISQNGGLEDCKKMNHQGGMSVLL